MGFRSYLSPRILGLFLIIFPLMAVLLSPVYSKYLGSAKGGNDAAKRTADDTFGAYVKEPGCASCTIPNSKVKRLGQSRPRDSAIATPSAHFLAQFSQPGPKLVGADPEDTNQVGHNLSISAAINPAAVGATGDGDFTDAPWIYAGSVSSVFPALITTHRANQDVTGGANADPVVASAVGFAISPPVNELLQQPSATRGQTGEAVIAMREARFPRRQPPELVARMGNEGIQTSATALIPVPSASFDGLNSQDNATSLGFRVYPPDPNGDVGPNHYVQAVNLLVRVYSKTGTALTPPFKMSSLFASLGGVCSNTDDGDPIVLYDPLADRWLLSQFAFANFNSPPYHQCIAISKTSDPTGAYFMYDFVMPGSNLNDYPHFGVWSDGYYMTDNQFQNGFTFKGAGVFAFDRAKMLAGNSTASYIYFDLGTSYSGMLPADVDGLAAPPTGTPNYFAMFQATLFGDPSDAMRLFSFHADFNTPANSTFIERPESPIVVTAFDPRSPNTQNVIEQPNPATTKMYLDGLQDRLMHRLAYRNFGGTRESLVVTQTVNVGADPTTVVGHQAAIRYYEFRRSLPAGPFTVPEQATFAPDTDNRWMGSAAMDSQGNIAVGYSVSSKGTYPSIRYAGRLASDPPNGLFQGEAVLVVGSGVQRGTVGRWGDYSALSVDPSDDCTFWYTTEYYTATSQGSSEVGWLTRIGSFKFPNCGAQIFQGTVTGTITDPVAGVPMTGAMVSFSPGGYTAVRSAGGSYSATVPTGTYTLTASATHRVSQTVSGVMVTNGGTTTVNFSLPFPANTGRLTGHVRNGRTNAPLANALVTASPGGISATTDEDGLYELYLSTGTYTVTASSADFVDSSGTVVIADQGNTTRDFSLQPSSHLLAQLGEPSLSKMKLADLDGDGKSDVIVTTLENNPSFPGPQGSGRIHVLSSSGTELPGWPVTLNERPLNNTAAVGDIDGDGRLEIVVQTFGNQSQPSGTDPQKVWAFSTTGVLKPGFPVALGSPGDGWGTGLFGNAPTPSPALADLTGDGVPEIIAIWLGSAFGTDGGGVVAVNGNGTILFRTVLPRSVPPGRFFDEYPHYSVPMIGNLIGDASPEIVVGVGAGAGSPHTTFFALTATGGFLPGWPIHVGPPTGLVIEYGALGDLYHDGHDALVVTYAPSQNSAPGSPAQLYVFDGSGHAASGFPKDLPGSAPYDKYPGRPGLVDVDHDGFLDIVTVVSDQITNYLVAYNRFGQQTSQTQVPGQYYWRLEGVALAEDATGQVCAVFPALADNSGAQLLLNAMYLNGQAVPGFPLALPILCDSFACQAASSLSLTRDRDTTQVYSVLIDASGNVRKWDIFNSTRPIPWSQFQNDAANSGLARNLQTLTVTKNGTGTGTVSSSLSGIICGATCSSDFNSGTVLALTASADPGSSFTGWTGSGAGSFTGGTNQATVTMNGPITQTAGFVQNQIHFSAANISVSEAAGFASVTVSRLGDVSAAASVDFATSDGTAKQNRDYTIASGTLLFAAGQASRDLSVLVTDNAYVDGSRTLNITLSNPSNIALTTPTIAALTINDNDSSPPLTNPLDNTDARFFVRQHYSDFLSRTPDQGGFDFWAGQITQCGSDLACSFTKRIDVSNAFYYELEFQQTGSYVYRVYRESFGNNQPFPNPNPDPQHLGEEKKLPLYSPFMRDRARVRGGPQLAQLQLDFANTFAERDEFKNKYPAGLGGPGFVDALLANINNDLGVDVTSQRQALIDLFNAGGRGAVLYRLADDNPQTNPINNRALIDAEYNRAFVFTQYAGYLRRNADMAGFLFWLGQVNSGPLRDVPKQHAMVCSFITSSEYQLRFSPVVTHSNAECPQ